jgi:hypothetical protein
MSRGALVEDGYAFFETVTILRKQFWTVLKEDKECRYFLDRIPYSVGNLSPAMGARMQVGIVLS